MDDSEPTNDVEIKNHKFGITLEPVMMLINIGIHANLMVQANLFEERVCLHSDLGQNKSVNCYNITAAEQEIIQPAATNFLMFKNLIETFVPCLMTLFLGAWSDVNGRKPLLLSAISGIVISNCMFSVFSTIPSLSPVMFLLCSLPVAVSGGTGVLYLAAFCYIVDVIDNKSRAFRIVVLYTFIDFGSILGSVLSTILYSSSTTYVYCLSSFVSIAGLLYTYIFLKESVVIKMGANTKLFNIQLIRDLWQTVMKQRLGYLRCIIILSAVSLALNLIVMFGEGTYMYMYLQKQFSWTLEKFLPFRAYMTLLHAIVPAIVVYVLNAKLQIPEMYIVTAVTAVGIFEKIYFAYSIYEWQLYAVEAVGSTVYATQTLIRSQLSKSFPSEEIGKILTFISLVESHGILLYSPIYNTIYAATVQNFANCIFFFSAILGIFMLCLFGIILFLLSRSTKTDDFLIEN
ncbi:proton-coupled folate transporter-like [Rhopalosiphum maidis]|uniref:proton-coupled folate transporter-like n=1 Tax=Rhopalosiphum maidis TaxID=43146 RepID=UPI000EFE45A8|nr:proton-coupled folate transporter-like [Rhopalosiphum maidis]